MRKMQNKKGFTLMEMLIVVAIIAILVAIAIPTFTGSLTDAKEAADNANVRAAYSEATAAYLLDSTKAGTASTTAMQADYDGTTIIGDLDLTTNNWKAKQVVTITVDSTGATLTAK